MWWCVVVVCGGVVRCSLCLDNQVSSVLPLKRIHYDRF